MRPITAKGGITGTDLLRVTDKEGNTMSHFIEQCKVCKKIIKQCRCMACDKTKIKSICDKCKK